MQKNVVIAILSIVLLVLVLMTIGYGCSFNIENFEDVVDDDTETDTEEEPKKKSATPKAAAEEKSAEPSALTPKEKEMFENIKNGSLTDEDIQKFIAEGKLTEQMVEKFLEHVEAPALPSTPSKATTPSPTKKPTAASVEEDMDIEGFSGSMYAKF